MAKPKKSNKSSDSGGGNSFNFDQGDFSPDITFTFKPKLSLVTRDLNKFAGDIRSFREPLTLSVRQVLAPSFRKNFDVGGRPTKWAPTKPETIERRKSKAGGVLVDTGALRDAASSPSIWNVTGTSATVTGLPSRVRYGAAHQGGYNFKAGKKVSKSVSVPARPFLVIQDEDVRAIEEIFFKWIEQKARKRGFTSRIGR